MDGGETSEAQILDGPDAERLVKRPMKRPPRHPCRQAEFRNMQRLIVLDGIDIVFHRSDDQRTTAALPLPGSSILVVENADDKSLDQ